MTVTRKGVAHLDGRSFYGGVFQRVDDGLTAATVTRTEKTLLFSLSEQVPSSKECGKGLHLGSGQERERCGSNHSNVDFWLEHKVVSNALACVSRHGSIVSEWKCLARPCGNSGSEMMKRHSHSRFCFTRYGRGQWGQGGSLRRQGGAQLQWTALKSSD